ncbi:hypothetical protein PPYR_08125 [Photinus pyralis]|uniref:Endonuclease/exonuclease/phosphatase domain-containing protein n=2 Tax=Photinus pyralis TaxID=7054 RepID=A0A5N4AII0_PHOPY|nr:uncharacterized protein LOC116172298 [Photinus pyralis]KAB0797131.1 hypothetical protein PPYR_08125 [Photinus pyralis]
MKIVHVNVRSLISKFSNFKDMVIKGKFDVVMVSETWLNCDISDDLINIVGYTVLRKDRCSRGGGVAIYVKQPLNNVVLNTPSSIEQLWVGIEINRKKVTMGCLYRPPHCDPNFFVDELEETLTNLIMIHDYVLAMGDLNFNLLLHNNSSVEYFTMSLQNIGFYQLVDSPTRITSTTSSLLDLLITNDCGLVSACDVVSVSDLADHDLVVATLELDDHVVPNLPVLYRAYKQLDMHAFDQELHCLPFLDMLGLEGVNLKLEYFNSLLSYLLNKHLPLKSKVFKKTPSLWLSENTKLLIKLRDNALRKSRQTGKPQH